MAKYHWDLMALQVGEVYLEERLHQSCQLVGFFWEKLQETPICHGKIYGFL